MSDQVRLGFGYNDGLPEDVTAAWGARAIVTQTGSVDLPHDRQSTAGPRPQIRKLVDKLNNGINREWIAAAKSLLCEGTMKTRESGEFVLAKRDGVVVKGNTNGSGGYLYVCAYPAPPDGEE